MRPGQQQHIALTLWPFLDILSCLAGALTVIIATLLVTQLVEDPVKNQAVNDKLAQMRRELEWKQAEVARYKGYIQKQAQQQAAAQKAREEYLSAQQDLEEQLRRQAMLVSLMQQKDEAQRQIRELRERYAKQEAEINQLRIAQKGRATTNISDRIEVHFTGRGQNLRPTFVECTPDGIVIREGKEMGFVRTQNIGASDDYRRVLGRAGETLGGTVIFLIRPSGVDAFARAEEVALRAGVRNGKLPIPGEGVIDLGPYGGKTTSIPPTGG
ncbi:MAG TPA: hypothetical protein P5205_08235 [Candidatus Paceibacterota bacterium]|nr:hypothetical protein [Verrucomicrobiota bacterium]HSA10347.1 hypothetical protein [Candidatus Paceibacterota bacterium]